MGNDVQQIRELRNLTGAGVMECKRALEDTQGDFARAQALLQEKAQNTAQKKACREATAGTIGAYLHNDGRIGVLIEVYCETDFLSRNPEFRGLVKELMLQIASEEPQYIRVEEVPPEVIRHVEEKAVQMAQALGKPERTITLIKEGKVRKFLDRACLMEQRFIKDPELTIAGLVQRFIARSGENIQIRRFTRYQVEQ
jgi:elongation factor Ts